jgi:hypothetical protein
VITLAQALAVRRLLFAAAALAATLGAHAIATGGLRLLPAAPAFWGWLLIGAAFLGPRRSGWRERGPLWSIALLVAAQALLHAAMSVAPWLFGLGVHHSPPLLTTSAVLAHLGAAVVLGLLLARAERLLSAAQRVVRTIRAALAPLTPRRPRLVLAPGGPARAPRRSPCRVPDARGPPALTV